MTIHYRTAREQIEAMLSSRTQADPLLEAEEIWDELDCWPVPSVRTVQRYMDEIRNGIGVQRQEVGAERQTQPKKPGTL